MTERQKKEIVFALVEERERWRAVRNEGARNVRNCDAKIAAILETPIRKCRAGRTARQGGETGNLCRISKSKVAPTRAERKRGLTFRDDAERRVRTLARQFRVTPELEGGAR